MSPRLRRADQFAPFQGVVQTERLPHVAWRPLRSREAFRDLLLRRGVEVSSLESVSGWTCGRTWPRLINASRPRTAINAHCYLAGATLATCTVIPETEPLTTAGAPASAYSSFLASGLACNVYT